MMYKTSNKDHKPSIGILADLIKKHGNDSEEVRAYMVRFSGNEHQDFQKKASLLINPLASIFDIKKDKE